MAAKIDVKLKCPHCNFPIKARVRKNFKGFLLYVCPRCNSNVVYYDNRIDIISNRLLKKILRQKRLISCGILHPYNKAPSESISSDDILNLRILLETTGDVEEFLSHF